MPTPSYKQVKSELMTMRQQYRKLATDPILGLYTRAALEFELPRVEKDANYIVVIDTYLQDNTKVRKIIARKHAGILLRASWSPYEIVVILSDDPQGYIERMRTAFTRAGLYASFASVPFGNEFEIRVNNCLAIIQAKKNGYEA